MLIATNDKYLNVYDICDKKIIVRFFMEHLQSMLQYSK